MSRLTLSLLGSLQVTLDAKPVTDLRYDKLRALLCFLAVEADRPHRRNALVGLLWPDLSEEAARANLRQALATLRTVIGDRTAEPPFLLISHESIRWNPQAETSVDVRTFEGLLRACRDHAHERPDRCRPCVQRYVQAIELYGGDFLDHFHLPDSALFEEWAVLKREDLHRQALDALGLLASFFTAAGEYEQAEYYLRRRLVMEPWDEGSHHDLMRVLMLSNRRTQALAHYEQCRRILAEELGVEPGPEIVGLYEQLQAASEALPASMPGTGQEPAAALTPEHPHNLPPQPTPFLGRREELREIGARLADSTCRLLTLTGTGGIGKTRLALEAASAALVRFRHGVYFVPLAAIGSSDLLTDAIGQTIGCPFTPHERAQAQLLRFLAPKEMLLVLDNFEHLLAGADLLAAIRAAAPAVRLLVTSRERLSLQGEWIFTVHGLPYPPVEAPTRAGGTDLADQYSAMDLFVRTAVRLQPDFVLTHAEAASIARICRLVEGMPLAIELAAAWVRVLSPLEIAEEIERGLAFLAADLRDVAERHRSLRAVFDHSWHLLAPAEQDVFRRLAVFRGSCERAAAEQVAGASLPLLAALVDKSLLRRTPAGRYELHEHLRQYGADRLHDAGQTAETQDRHLAYCLNLAETAEPHLQEMHSTTWLDKLQAENDNLRVALAWSLAGGNSEAGLRLAAALWVFWWVRGHTGEGRTWLASLLAQNPTAPTAQRAKAERAAGALAYYQADLVAAEQHFVAALTLFREVGDQRGTSRALRNLSVVLGEQGRFGQARTYAEESLAIARSLGDVQNLANALSDLGVLDYYLRDYARALSYLEESLALNRTLDDQHDIAVRLHNLAELVAAMGDDQRALALHAESLAIFRAAENKYGVAFSLQAQADIYCTGERLEQAWLLWQEALALFRQLGDRQGMGLIVLGLAGLAQQQKRWEHATLLLGALDRLLDEDGITFKPPDRDRTQRMAAAVRAQLPEDQFAAAWNRGRSLGLEEAVRQALAQGLPAPSY
jgi:predicted ATPase/DNA-binding SARP family transcriptional activator